jgi:ribulose-5-phosphate 4-epimerase/fuculose-1-phosphate aldolase
MAEEYNGVKFKTILKNLGTPADPRLEELRYWCRIFHEKNLAPPYQGGSYGNLSFRINPGENKFIITGTCIGLKDTLTDDCFVKVVDCDLRNALVYAEGKRYPSSESMLHFSIYNQRPDINVIFHGHCKEILQSAQERNIPETETEESYGTIELVNSVLKITEKNNFICIKNHGFISLANSMSEAGEKCLEILQKI